MKKKVLWISLASVVFILALVRFFAPGILLKEINSYLAEFSESYLVHVDDFDLSILRGAYRFEKVTVYLKKDGERAQASTAPFAKALNVDVSLAWRELFRGRILTDVVINEAELKADAIVTQPAREDPNRSLTEAKQAKSKLFPVETERIEFRNSRIDYTDLNIFADQIEGRLSHVTATEKDPISLLSLRGFFMGKAAIKIVGELNWVDEPTSWLFKAEVQRFDLTQGNFLLGRYVPLTFKKGILDLYSEVKYETGRISGYVKPFLQNAEVMGDDKDFKGLKHFGVELSVALINTLFKRGNNQTVATKILFEYQNKDFQWNLNETLATLFQNGYQEQLSRGIENQLKLKN